MSDVPIFDPTLAAREASEIHEVLIKELNARVRFKPLTMKDLAHAQDYSDPTEHVTMMVFIAMEKAMPGLKVDDVRKLKAGHLAALANVIARESGIPDPRVSP